VNSFRQHIPAFVETDRPVSVMPFETTEQLLALDVVRRHIGPTHSHFAMSDNCLMEISDEGLRWWVVGFIEKPDAVDLPRWKGWRHLARLADGREVIIEPDDTNPVVSSCGGELTRRDGSRVRDALFDRRMAKQARDRELRDRGICPTHETPYRRVETPVERGLIEVQSFCDKCGGLQETRWRRDA
jgi:hypothetical protein